MSGDRRDIRSQTLPELVEFFSGIGEKGFRAHQVWEWLWQRSTRSFDEMTSLPVSLRKQLEEHFLFPAAVPVETQTSRDGTIKTAFRLEDGAVIENVRIPSGGRITLCISSQVGCALGCKFCATGRLGFRRNLAIGEIYDQVTDSDRYDTPVTNIVFMGMGEPFLNYENVTRTIERITAPDGMGFSPQRITVSSVGIPRMIRKMADDKARYHFALSLHAPTDEQRSRLIPFNLSHPLAEVSDALKYYHGLTRKRFTIEYILFGGINDSVADARELARFCRSFPVKVNLIEYNPVEGTGFKPSTPEKTKAFAATMEKFNMVVNLRQSRGKDIEAACGQLAGKH
ncbi:MAG TPA: 23S rRNA (adenine(2503)-C(2))-methyltransferase RlmN [Bacteroidales bacterium]|nr:23S rRNA (adenine(2503)-C(2))-methyltransferase RlmN [Bacteroidales bacterium]HPS62968.1 23S rRNA (adenine(2503)-C(2))-methyltransferase RlmN [Bacteroidales bacterium]